MTYEATAFYGYIMQLIVKCNFISVPLKILKLLVID